MKYIDDLTDHIGEIYKEKFLDFFLMIFYALVSKRLQTKNYVHGLSYFTAFREIENVDGSGTV